MKKIFCITIVLSIIFAISGINVFADSPITSTDFYTSYDDVKMVNVAKENSIINCKLSRYLHSKKVSIDKKAAVINALGYDIDGKNNADLYAKLIYKKSVDELNVNKLKYDDAFVIGYLKALDDYFTPELALPYLNMAVDKEPDSYTVNVIHSIVEAQAIMFGYEIDDNDWNSGWELYKFTIDKDLEMDMRNEAAAIIFDYMVLYASEVVENPYN